MRKMYPVVVDDNSAAVGLALEDNCLVVGSADYDDVVASDFAAGVVAVGVVSRRFCSGNFGPSFRRLPSPIAYPLPFSHERDFFPGSLGVKNLEMTISQKMKRKTRTFVIKCQVAMLLARWTTISIRKRFRRCNKQGEGRRGEGRGG